MLKSKICYFLKHTFIKRQQQKLFGVLKANISEKKAVIQVDFAENFTIKMQNEIQSAH